MPRSGVLEERMMDLPSRRPRSRALLGMALAAGTLAVLVPRHLKDPERALQQSVASALASGDRLLEVALEHYPDRAPAIAITYGHLELFREQLARFGPQVVPIVAAYQHSFTTADALQIAGHTFEAVRQQLAGSPGALDLAPITPEDRGLIALLNMREEGNAFVGQWELTDGCGGHRGDRRRRRRVALRPASRARASSRPGRHPDGDAPRRAQSG